VKSDFKGGEGRGEGRGEGGGGAEEVHRWFPPPNVVNSVAGGMGTFFFIFYKRENVSLFFQNYNS
jgi:hypothetical protein